MIKRVNFTGRKRIPRSRVDIEVHDGQPRRFDATVDLAEFSFTPDAAVVLEATCAGSTVVQRYEFGSVGHIQAPENRLLRDIEGENVFFTLKVIDRTERAGRILGLAEHIRPERAGKQTATGRRGILPIEKADLGQELWRLDFQEHDVYLLVNKNVPDLPDRARSDPAFYAFVYPEVVRRVLQAALEEAVDQDEEDDSWPVLWRRFGQSLHPNGEKAPDAPENEDEAAEWVEDVVGAFCEAHELRDKYTAMLSGESERD